MFDWLNQAKSIEIQCQWLHHVSSCYIRSSSWLNRFISKFKYINYIHTYPVFFGESSTLFGVSPVFFRRVRGATWAPKGLSPARPRPRDLHLGNHLGRGWKKWWKTWGEIRTVTARVIPVIRCYEYLVAHPT